MKPISVILLFLGLLLWACGGGQGKKTEKKTADMAWAEIEQAAQGSSLQLMMWQGDPFINRYVSEYLQPQLKERFGIELQVSSGQGPAIVSNLMTEIEAGKDESEIDLVWINGETFFQLRQIDALHGPFTQQLPNAQYIDFDNKFIGQDFQQPIDGFECPWGNVQLAIIYDSLRTPEPPRSLEALEAYVKAHPGKFTIPNEFTGMTLLKSWLIAFAGGQDALNGPFDEAKYEKHSATLWAYVNRLKPYFWKQGETFPALLSNMHQMFANGELDFSMSNNDGEVDNKIAQGVFPESARAFVFESGTIQNSHYMGIVKHSAHKAAAMVALNFLISPEAQLHKYNPEVWGDGTVLDRERLPTEWQERFASLPQRRYAPKRSEIQPYALQELAPEYMIRLFDDFRKKVIE